MPLGKRSTCVASGYVSAVLAVESAPGKKGGGRAVQRPTASAPVTLTVERSKVVTAETDKGQGAKQMRRLFFIALVEQLRVVWPIMSGIITIMVGCGAAIWRIEDWGLGEALYFTFVTGLTIGYGDFTPKHFSARVLALVIGFAGIVLTGLIAAVTVKALNAADRNTAK
ncbi:putative membrane protein (plasmid) [Rhizobium favelukesii]|uniref:Membrane protein n=2 Tax=Rhizobium/Agrobacterium group TaxID=227290 RepID=W6S741_9HYPH|nr:putative membrane protein [Rhizobium favelukesii]